MLKELPATSFKNVIVALIVTNNISISDTKLCVTVTDNLLLPTQRRNWNFQG